MIIDIDPIRGLIEKVGGDMKTKLPNLIHINGLTPEFRDSFTDLLREKRVPIVYAAHFSHLDGPVISDVCKAFICIAQEAELEDMLRGFSLTVASSMREGHQGKFLESIYTLMKEYSADRGVEFVPITREKDKREHNMEALGKEALPLARGLQKGFGFAVFPGGSVQPGRSDGYGGIHGMQEIEDADLIDLYQFVERFGRQGRDEAFFQPVGIENTHKLFSPDSRFPTVEGLIGLYAAKSLLEELGLSLVPINVNVGMPVARDDLVSALGTNWINDPKAVNHFLMGYSALLVPPSARGVYKAA